MYGRLRLTTDSDADALSSQTATFSIYTPRSCVLSSCFLPTGSSMTSAASQLHQDRDMITSHLLARASSTPPPPTPAQTTYAINKAREDDLVQISLLRVLDSSERIRLGNLRHRSRYAGPPALLPSFLRRHPLTSFQLVEQRPRRWCEGPLSFVRYIRF